MRIVVVFFRGRLFLFEFDFSFGKIFDRMAKGLNASSYLQRSFNFAYLFHELLITYFFFFLVDFWFGGNLDTVFWLLSFLLKLLLCFPAFSCPVPFWIAFWLLPTLLDNLPYCETTLRFLVQAFDGIKKAFIHFLRCKPFNTIGGTTL